MKTIFIILSLFFITNCDKKEEISQETTDLVASWYLMSFNPGFGQTEDYNTGDIIWIINSENSISVTLDVTTSTQLPLNENGSYSYNIISNNSVSIENIAYEYQLEGQTLKLLDNPSSDGIILTFQKVTN
jgi:hypothetical protein|tara:strand:- start:572 stop:961 length:390 start_codon:yes stop_codon:yes gene_type:complete